MSSVNEVTIEEVERAVLKLFGRKDFNRRGELKICEVTYPRDALKVWLHTMLESGIQALRISAGVSMVHGHRIIRPSDIRQAFRIQRNGANEIAACICQQENTKPQQI